jgi:hypothetical protein
MHFSITLNMANNHIHSDSKKRRSFLALLFATGDVRRWRRQRTRHARTSNRNGLKGHTALKRASSVPKQGAMGVVSKLVPR